MAIPTAAPWDLANFDESNLATLLGLGASDLSISPSVAPYFVYDSTANLLRVTSVDGVLATADFNVPVPSRQTMEVTVRFPQLPDDVGDVANHRMGLTVADDSSRGVSLYFARTGLAVSRIDDFGSVSPLPDSTDDIREVDQFFHTIRVAIDGSLGRAYVFIGLETDTFLPLRYIIPVEATPSGVVDTFQVFVHGSSTDQAQMEIKRLRLGSGLIISNLPPTADAGPDRVVPVGQAARLDGRSSFDLEGAPITYAWKAVDAPFGSQYAHDNSGGSTIDDGDSDGFTDTLSFTPNSVPTWATENDVLLIQGSRHVIDTVASSSGQLTVKTDTLPDDLSVVPFRIIRQSLLVGVTSETPIVVPDIQGLYRFELTVNDGEATSEPTEVLVSVVGARAPFGVEPSVEFLWDALGDEWRFVENRTVFQEFWRGTAQLLGGKLLEAWQYHYNYSINNAQRVFQRKWLAYKTLIVETAPDEITIDPRYGLLYGTVEFTSLNLTGKTLVVEFADDESAVDVDNVTITFSGGDPVSIADAVSQATAALAGTGIVAADIGGLGHFVLASTTRAFRVLSTSTAVADLGLPTDRYNYLEGSDGARVTDRTYRVDEGIDLSAFGTRRNDLLVLNNGQSFRIDRVFTGPGDKAPNQRILLFDPLPADASETWEIPSLIRSTEVDYEREGSYPGDLVKAEVFDTNDSSTTDVRGIVVAQRGSTVGVQLDGFFSALLDTLRYEIRLLGVKRRKAIPVDSEVVSVPQLQDKVAQSAGPTLWKENIDYYLEPFYRETDGTGIPMLQFRDEVFITPDEEPPDIFWAELTLFSNEGNIENLFGRLVGFLREDAATYGEDFSYASAVAGLLYAYQRGPRVWILKTGAQILFGQPFAEVKGIITEIRDDFSPTTGRMLVQDYDGFDPPRTEIVRSYVYTKDPLDTSSTSGLEVNLETGAPFAVGDTIEQFAPIGTGVDILDYINDPTWYYPFVRSGVMTELEKFHTFAVEFNVDLVSLVGLALAQQFLFGTKPTYTHPVLLGAKNLEEDIDIVDVLSFDLTMHLLEACSGYASGGFPANGLAYAYDDFRGDGTTWSSYGLPWGHQPPAGGTSDHDGKSYYDGILDCVSDYIDMDLVLDWSDTAASIEGTADLAKATYPGDFGSRVLILDIDGSLHTTTFAAGTPDQYSVVTQINLAVGTVVASLGGDHAWGRIVSAYGTSHINDGEDFVIDDGINPAVTFEFDDNNSVAETATLRKVDISGSPLSGVQLMYLLIDVINNAPTLDVLAGFNNNGCDIVHNYPGSDKNIPITESVSHPGGLFVTGMNYGTDTLVITSPTTGVNSYVEVDYPGTTLALFTVLGFYRGGAIGSKLVGTKDLSSATYPGDFSGRTLQVLIDGATHNITFSGSVADPTDIRDEIIAVAGAGTAAIDSLNRLELISTTTGASSEVEIGAGTTAALLPVLGFAVGQQEQGDANDTSRAKGNVVVDNADHIYDNKVTPVTITGDGPAYTSPGTPFYPPPGYQLTAGGYLAVVVTDPGNDVLP